MEGSCWSWKQVGGGIQGLKDDTVEVYCYQASLISLSLFEREFYFLFFTLTQCDYILFLLAKSTSFQAFYPLSTQTMCCRILMKTKLMFKCFYHILSCFIIAPTCQYPVQQWQEKKKKSLLQLFLIIFQSFKFLETVKKNVRDPCAHQSLPLPKFGKPTLECSRASSQNYGAARTMFCVFSQRVFEQHIDRRSRYFSNKEEQRKQIT